MPLVRYVANVDATEGTSILRLKKSENAARLLVQGGAPLEITDEEFARLSGRYLLQTLDAPQEEPVVPDVPDSPPEVEFQAPFPTTQIQSTISSTPGGSSDEHPDTP